MNDKKIDLTPELRKPLDKNLMNNDVAVLRSLIADMNNPALTGAEVPKGESTNPAVPLAPAESFDKHGATMPPGDPLTAGQEQPQKIASVKALTAEWKKDRVEKVFGLQTVRQPSAEAVQLLKAEEAIVIQQLDFCRENGIVPVPNAGQALRNWLVNRNLKLAFKQLQELRGEGL